MREIDLSSKKDCFYLLVGDKLNTNKLLVLLECLKDRAFDRADCLRSSCLSRGQLWNLEKGLCGLYLKPYFHGM